MNYLLASEFEAFGLDATTHVSTVTAASGLIDAHCRRPTLSVAEYKERLRVSAAGTVRLSYLPLVANVIIASGNQAQHAGDPVGEVTTPLLAVRARYAATTAIVGAGGDFGTSVARAFSLPGAWIDVDVRTVDCDLETGEITLPANALGLAFDDAEITYHAGFAVIPSAVKTACAQIVRNALATPALNVRASSMERMHMEYFADTLLDSNVRALLAPYVAQRLG